VVAVCLSPTNRRVVCPCARQDAAYLEKAVASALVEGLSAVVQAQPQDSVDFLGQFLVKYADTQELLAKVRRAPGSLMAAWYIQRNEPLPPVRVPALTASPAHPPPFRRAVVTPSRVV
jgi:hypothetical protein